MTAAAEDGGRLRARPAEDGLLARRGLLGLATPRTSRARRRGVALADFLAGMLILGGALTAFSSMTRSKLDALAAADQHARALAAAEEALDRVRAAGLPRAPEGEADPDGFRLVLVFSVRDLPDAMGRVEVRSLRVEGDGPAYGLYEARAVVRWQDGPLRHARVALSTVAAAPVAEGPR